MSLVDHRPQELLVLSLDGLVLEWAAGSSGGLAYSQFGARLRDLQVREAWYFYALICVYQEICLSVAVTSCVPAHRSTTSCLSLPTL